MSRFSIEGERAGQALIDWETRIANLERRPVPVMSSGPGSFVDVITSHTDVRGYWRCGEASGDLADTSAYGIANGTRNLVRDVTSPAATYDVTGLIAASEDDGAIQITTTSGEDGNVFSSIADTARFAMVGNVPHTVECFFKPTSLPVFSLGGGIAGTLYSTGSGGSERQSGWGLWHDADGKVSFRRGGESTGVAKVTTTFALTNGVGYHLAGTYDGTTQKIYLNGELISSLVTAQAVASTTFWVIGMGGITSSATSKFPRVKGVIDEVVMYNVALSDSTIADHALRGGYSSSIGGHTVYAAYTALHTDRFVLADGTFTVTLPTAAGYPGTKISVKNIGTGTITVGRTSAQLIDGVAADITLTTQRARRFVSDGSNWQITNDHL